jgi:hypothetical protein
MIWLPFGFFVLVFAVAFTAGYFWCLSQIPRHLAQFTIEELKALSDKVAKERERR